MSFNDMMFSQEGIMLPKFGFPFTYYLCSLVVGSVLGVVAAVVVSKIF